MGQNPSHFKGKPKNPVESVSWLDAVRFCNQLSEREGLKPFYEISGETVQVPDWNGTGYRLPTEAEWEYACRRGRATRYCFGDDEAAWVSSPGSVATRMGEPMRWARSARMPLACTICMAMSGSGVGTGTADYYKSPLWTTPWSLAGLVPGDPRRELDIIPRFVRAADRHRAAGLPGQQPGLPRGPSPVRRLSSRQDRVEAELVVEGLAGGATESRGGAQPAGAGATGGVGHAGVRQWGFRDSGPRSGSGRAL